MSLDRLLHYRNKERLYGFLYLLEFASGKFYVGITSRFPELRYRGHEKSAIRYDSPLPVYRAWRKYGAPKLTVLAVLEKRMLAAAEKRAIRVYGTVVPGGYNIMSGGEGALLRSAVLSPEELLRRSQAMLGDANPVNKPGVRERISASLIGGVASEETKLKISSALLGRKHTAEHIAARVESRLQNDSMKGKKYPQMGRDMRGERNSFFGKTHTDETKQKISECNIGNTKASGQRTEEQKARMSAAHEGVPLSKTHRIRMMVSIATTWALKSGRSLSLLEMSQ